MTAAIVRTYSGPACPRCTKPLDHAALHDGETTCPHCARPFEVRVFHPHHGGIDTLQLAQSGPDEGTPCAYHARNAAITGCERCGVFICSLCEMTVDSEKYCPSCFDRLAEEGEGAARTRIRDFGGLAILSAAAGLFFAFFLGIPAGILSWYYAIKAWRNPENSSAGTPRLLLAMTIGLIDFALQAFIVFSFILAMTRK